MKPEFISMSFALSGIESSREEEYFLTKAFSLKLVDW